MMFTNEQINVLLSMGDLSNEERKMLEQQRDVNNLNRQARGQTRNFRMDAGSQAARALAGLGAGLGQRQVNQTGERIGDQRRSGLKGMFPEKAKTLNEAMGQSQLTNAPVHTMQRGY